MRPYLQAKSDADDALMASGLDWTIVRPGRLTDEPGTGRSTRRGRSGGAARSRARTPRRARRVPAAGPTTIRVAFELLGGGTPVPEAVGAL